MQIRDYMTKLFDAFGDVEEVTREMLLEQAELIHTISDKCQSTGLFLDSQVRFNQFVQEIEADDKQSNALRARYGTEALAARCNLCDPRSGRGSPLLGRPG